MSDRGKQLFGVANFRPMNGLAHKAIGGSCFVDGREIKQAWFVDTEAGIVKTYDVLGDGKLHSGREFTSADFPGREVESPWDGVVSETLHGKVDLFARPGSNRTPVWVFDLIVCFRQYLRHWRQRRREAAFRKSYHQYRMAFDTRQMEAEKREQRSGRRAHVG